LTDTTLFISPALAERAQVIITALKNTNLTIVTAESCTAGIIAAVLSGAEGAGEVLHGGFVTYTKEHKTAALDVSADLLRTEGAVNAEVVKLMARGALQHSPASLSIAVSGVLGPEEDEDGNAVGLVYFCCLKSQGQPMVQKAQFGKEAPAALLQLTLAGVFDLIEECINCDQR
jgi:PncC family amidohydrolase